MSLHALLVAYLPNARDAARQLFNHEMTRAGWRQYSVPFTWTKEFRDDELTTVESDVKRLEVERLVLGDLHEALTAAGSPTYSALLQIGIQPALADPPGWDRMTDV
jgi:hypothetical protein